jgi:hypothetical protein
MSAARKALSIRQARYLWVLSFFEHRLPFSFTTQRAASVMLQILGPR